MKSVTLHIGDPKTGSSAIQSFLSANRDRLRILYPAGTGDSRAAQGLPTSGNAAALVRRLKAGEDASALAAELESGAVYSSELFRSVPIKAFRDFLRCVDARMILYVRPQISAVLSGFAQVKANGKFAGDLAAFFESKRDRFKYSTRYAAFKRHGSFTVRPYIRARLTNADIVDDFCSTIGIDIPAGAVRFGNVNARERPDITPALAWRIADYFRHDNVRLDAMTGARLELNEANDADLQRIVADRRKLPTSR